jgi:hypothetical protein
MIVLFVFLLTLESCITVVKLPVSPITPPADGTVKIKKDKNYVIDLSVNYLVGPKRLNPPKKHYVGNEQLCIVPPFLIKKLSKLLQAFDNMIIFHIFVV